MNTSASGPTGVAAAGVPQGPVDLRSETLTLRLLPALGGCCATLRTLRKDGVAIDILRPMPAGSTDPFDAGCFALLPWSNRLFGHRLLMRDIHGAGGQTHIAPNRAGIAFAVHGIGWKKSWQVRQVDAARVEMAYEHAADATWPFTHTGVLTMNVTGRVARFEAALHNRSAGMMPAGLGFHPWFQIDEARTHVRFDAATVWHQDAAGAPTEERAVAGDPNFDFSAGRSAASVQMDHCYAGWSRSASIIRPACSLAVRLTASVELGHLVVYRPATGTPWICIEPVSHATGAFSLPALQHAILGAVQLAPGASLRAWMEIQIEDR